MRTGVRTVHLAEILASTDEACGFPEAARAALATRSCAATSRKATHDDPRQARAGGRGAAGLGGAARGGAGDQGPHAAPPRLLSRASSRQAVQARGGTVHWARDAAEANSIVVALAAARGAHRGREGQVAGDRRDRAERGAGRRRASRAIETDLAELIIQLDDDRSSHILVPAIHRNRAEIRELFMRELGAGRAERRAGGARRGGPAAPAAEVPRGSRGGVSGANFAVAETGTSASSSPRATGACA